MRPWIILLLALATPALAQSPTQGPPDMGIDTSGTLRKLSVRDATLGSRVPLAILDTTVHSFVTPSILVESYGAISGDGLDDKAAIQAALTAGAAANTCVTGSGKTYRVNGSVLLPDKACLRDITLYQVGILKTLTNVGAGSTGPYTLRNVKIDYTSVPKDNGSSLPMGLHITNAHDIDIDGIEVTGSGQGSAFRFEFVTNAKVRRLYIHDIDYTSKPGVPDPEQEQVQAMGMYDVTDFQLTDFKIDNLWGFYPWTANQDISTQGLNWKVNEGNSYRATTSTGTTGVTAPTCTGTIGVTTCSDGVVTWTYMGPYPANHRSYEADGIAFTRMKNALVSNGIISRVWEGFDAVGTTNDNIHLSNILYHDIDAFGEKWGHCVTNSSSTGSQSIRAGLSGFVIGPGNLSGDACGPTNLWLYNPLALNSRSNGNWSYTSGGGFSIGAESQGVRQISNVRLVNARAIDDQAVKTMNIGFLITYLPGPFPPPSAVQLINPVSLGHLPGEDIHNPQPGMIVMDPTDGSTKVWGRLDVAGWSNGSANGQITLGRQDEGNQVIPLYIGNRSVTSNLAGSAALIDASATGQWGVRTTQFGGELLTDGQNGHKFTVKTSANGNTPLERFWCGLGCVIGNGIPANDKGVGSLNVTNGIYENGTHLSLTYTRIAAANTFNLQNKFRIDLPGAPTYPLVVWNAGNTVGTEACLVLSANSNTPVDTRAAQVCATNPNGAGNESGLALRTGSGGGVQDQLTFSPPGAGLGAVFKRPVTIDMAGSNNTAFTATSTYDSASPVGGIVLDRASPTPADGDDLSYLNFGGRTSTGLATNYAAMGGRIETAATGATNGSMWWMNLIGALPVKVMTVAKGLMVGTTVTDPGLGSIHTAGFVQTNVYTVGTLPVCTAALEGAVAGVNNANATTFNSVVSGGGTNHMAVRCNGTDWVIY